MSQAGLARVSSGALPPTVPLQFTGDNGTIAVPAGNNITIYTSTPTSGASVSFFNSGSTSLLKLGDNRNNIFLGNLAGPTGAYTGDSNCSLGAGTLTITSGSRNCAVGYTALTLLSTGNDNVGIGDAALSSLTTGINNIAFGSGAGGSYSSNESNNICLGDFTGSAGDQRVMYLGEQTTQTKCFIAGVKGVSVSNPTLMIINSSTGQAGVIGAGVNGVLISSSAGVPSWLANGTTGQVLTATTGSPASWSTISTGGFTWTDVTSATQTLAALNGYLTDRGAGVTYTLPASGTIGDTIKIVGKLGLATITPNANQQILMGSSSGAVGVTGTCVANNVGDCIELICTTSGASTVWRADHVMGTWTLN